MSVYAEILGWSSGLPAWQRDTLRRLAPRSVLGNADIKELTAACFDEANQRPVTSMVPIDASHVPGFAAGSPVVGLTAIAACRCLNRIADGQALSFGPSGLTIVYGDNATGKSGFARVLRQACRARGAGGEVLPDVYAANRGSPQASVQYAVDGASSSFDWSQGRGCSSRMRNEGGWQCWASAWGGKGCFIASSNKEGPSRPSGNHTHWPCRHNR